MNLREHNFPVKYAAMELKRISSHFINSEEFDSHFGLFPYVVAKCYLLSEIKKYLPDGSSKTTYEVVFDWNLNEGFDILPEFDLYDKCNKPCYVDFVSNDIEKIKEYSRKYNNELMMRVDDIVTPDILEETKKELQCRIKEAYEFEDTYLFVEKNKRHVLKK